MGQPQAAKLQNYGNIFYDNSKSWANQLVWKLNHVEAAKLQNYIHIFFDNSKSRIREAADCQTTKLHPYFLQQLKISNQRGTRLSNYKTTSIFSLTTQIHGPFRQPNSLNYKTTAKFFGTTQNLEATMLQNYKTKSIFSLLTEIFNQRGIRQSNYKTTYYFPQQLKIWKDSCS